MQWSGYNTVEFVSTPRIIGWRPTSPDGAVVDTSPAGTTYRREVPTTSRATGGSPGTTTPGGWSSCSRYPRAPGPCPAAWTCRRGRGCRVRIDPGGGRLRVRPERERPDRKRVRRGPPHPAPPPRPALPPRAQGIPPTTTAPAPPRICGSASIGLRAPPAPSCSSSASATPRAGASSPLLRYLPLLLQRPAARRRRPGHRDVP